jgi:hypothetical protein
MDTTLGSALLALIQQNEVRKNIEAEAQRKFLAKEQSAKAMNRADNEWR